MAGRQVGESVVSVHAASFHLSKMSWLSLESEEDSISSWAAAGMPSPGQAGRGNQEQLQINLL